MKKARTAIVLTSEGPADASLSAKPGPIDDLWTQPFHRLSSIDQELLRDLTNPFRAQKPGSLSYYIKNFDRINKDVAWIQREGILLSRLATRMSRASRRPPGLESRDSKDLRNTLENQREIEARTLGHSQSRVSSEQLGKERPEQTSEATQDSSHIPEPPGPASGKKGGTLLNTVQPGEGKGKALESGGGAEPEAATEKTRPRNDRKGDPTLLEGKDRVSFQTAEQYLGLGERQRQKLVRSGVLCVKGQGHNRKITTESLKKYLPPENPK